MTQQKPEKLDQTWFLDIDGTIFKNKSNLELDRLIKKDKYKSYLSEEILEGVKEWFQKLSPKDIVIFVTAREKRHSTHTEKALRKFGIKYKQIIYGINAGPRVLINDIKPADSNSMNRDIETAFSVNLKRDAGFNKVPVCFL